MSSQREVPIGADLLGRRSALIRFRGQVGETGSLRQTLDERKHTALQPVLGHSPGAQIGNRLCGLESVTVERPGLEDRFLEITEKEDAHAVPDDR